MKKLLIAFLLIASIAVASPYYIKVDNDGYVIDATSILTHATEYTLIQINEPICGKHLLGYYKIVDGKFIKDEAKYQEYLASQVEE